MCNCVQHGTTHLYAIMQLQYSNISDAQISIYCSRINARHRMIITNATFSYQTSLLTKLNHRSLSSRCPDTFYRFMFYQMQLIETG